MRLLIVFLEGELRFLSGPYLSGRTDACRNRANKEKRNERRQGKQKEEEGDCSAYSPPFARVSAALLIRTDATHRSKKSVVMQVVCSAPCDVANI